MEGFFGKVYQPWCYEHLLNNSLLSGMSCALQDVQDVNDISLYILLASSIIRHSSVKIKYISRHCYQFPRGKVAYFTVILSCDDYISLSYYVY